MSIRNAAPDSPLGEQFVLECDRCHEQHPVKTKRQAQAFCERQGWASSDAVSPGTHVCRACKDPALAEVYAYLQQQQKKEQGI